MAPLPRPWLRAAMALGLSLPLLAACQARPQPPPGSELIVEGRRLLSEETVGGELPLRLSSSVAARGQEIFNASREGKALDATQAVAVAAFLRVIDALENIRSSVEILQARAERTILPHEDFDRLLERAVDEIDDAVAVLEGGGLHPDAVAHLREARHIASEAEALRRPEKAARRAIAVLGLARERLVETPSQEPGTEGGA